MLPVHRAAVPARVAAAQRNDFRNQFCLTMHGSNAALVNFRSNPSTAFFEQLQMRHLGARTQVAVQVKIDAVRSDRGSTVVHPPKVN